MSKGSVKDVTQPWGIDRVFGSAPWLKPSEVRHYRVKTFKSGNSLALRLPAGLGLEPGMEMDLREQDGHYSLELVDRPKRKVDIAKFWGSVPDLVPIKPEDRVFEESKRPWDDPDWVGWADTSK